MSDTDSFIDEVTEEVRRDRLFATFRRYGWIAVALIVIVVGAAAWNEFRKAQAREAARALGDAVFLAISQHAPADRAASLSEITADSDGGNAVVEFALAGARAQAGQVSDAVALLDGIAGNGKLPEIYRQIASFKSLTLQADTMPAADLRTGFEALAGPGSHLRLLAEEQLALVDAAEGDAAAAIERFQAILLDAEATSDLQQRAAQAIVALGGEPQLPSDIQG